MGTSWCTKTLNGTTLLKNRTHLSFTYLHLAFLPVLRLLRLLWDFHFHLVRENPQQPFLVLLAYSPLGPKHRFQSTCNLLSQTLLLLASLKQQRPLFPLLLMRATNLHHCALQLRPLRHHAFKSLDIFYLTLEPPVGQHVRYVLEYRVLRSKPMLNKAQHYIRDGCARDEDVDGSHQRL